MFDKIIITYHFITTVQLYTGVSAYWLSLVGRGAGPARAQRGTSTGAVRDQHGTSAGTRGASTGANRVPGEYGRSRAVTAARRGVPSAERRSPAERVRSLSGPGTLTVAPRSVIACNIHMHQFNYSMSSDRSLLSKYRLGCQRYLYLVPMYTRWASSKATLEIPLVSTKTKQQRLHTMKYIIILSERN